MASRLIALFCTWTILLHAVHGQPAGTTCKLPRVRKSWDSFNATEKTVFKNAVQTAMDRGYQTKFIQMHIEYMSELEAHNQCMFIYWHRRYLLGYENMLRSLKPEFKCVTLPVWDHLYATAKRQTGRCNSLLSCSQVYQDLGGNTVGKNVNLQIYNQTIRVPTNGRCVNPANSVPASFCGQGISQTCQRCITRGNNRNDYPADAMLTSVMNQLFPPVYDWVNVATSIERGVHNMVHATIDGIMSYFQSPADPLFYTHHAFVDSLQWIHVKCAFNLATGLEPLSTAQRQSPLLWQACERRPTGSRKYWQLTDRVTMRVTDSRGVWVDVLTPGNLLYNYFKDLPQRYSDYVDARALGVYSYTYQFNPDSNLNQLYTSCRAAPRTVSLTPSLLADEAEDAAEAEGGWDTFTSVWKAKQKWTDKVHRWTVAIYNAALANGYSEQGALEMLEVANCMHKTECLSPVQDISETFRQNFNVKGHSRCFTLLDMIKKGDKVIGIPHWREITDKFLACPLKDQKQQYSEQQQEEETTTTEDDDDDDENDKKDKKEKKEKKEKKDKNDKKDDDYELQ